MLPIAPSGRWKPESVENPTGQILTLLAACVGLPYFVLATTSPLLQAWFSRTHPGRSPYRLYALSNVGSLLALLSFPFAVEPHWASGTQSLVWSIGFAAFALLGAVCALYTWRLEPREEPAAEAGVVEGEAPAASAAPRPGFVRPRGTRRGRPAVPTRMRNPRRPR